MRRILFVLTVATLGAILWPWSAPTIDWKAAAEQALAVGDCDRAVEVLDAASGAGSREAMEQVRLLTVGGRCDKHPVGRGVGTYSITSMSRGMETSEIYALRENDLGVGRHQVVALALWSCAEPYNGVNSVDYTQLSSAIPSVDWPIMALHRARREACLRILEAVAERLVDDGDRPALFVAYNMSFRTPLSPRPQASYLFARLLLGLGFDPGLPAKSLELVRDAAWVNLRRAANENLHLNAMRLMIECLHAGRYRDRDDGAAFFWVLRLRRMGEEHPLSRPIETALPAQERDRIRQNEEMDWELAPRNRV